MTRLLSSLLRSLDYALVVEEPLIALQWGDAKVISGHLTGHLTCTGGEKSSLLDSANNRLRVGARAYELRSQSKIKELREDLQGGEIAPGDSVAFKVKLTGDHLKPGKHKLILNLVVDKVGWFNGKPAEVEIELRDSGRFVDVERIIAYNSVEDFCRTAEEYFQATLRNQSACSRS